MYYIISQRYHYLPTMSRNKGSLARLALIGLMGGVGYSYLNIWCRRNVHPYKLKIDTETIDTRSLIYFLLCKLQKYSDINEDAFRKSVEFTDRLLLIESGLYSKQIKPVLQDRPRSYSYYKRAISCIEEIYTDSKSCQSARIQVEVHSIYIKIYDELKLRWENILKLTRDVS